MRSQHQLSVWSAIGRMLDEKLFPARAEAALRIFKSMIEELGASAAEGKVDALLRQILERTGYARMLEADNDPEAESRLGNLNELVNAASEAAERGENIAEFLDHAALVSDTDSNWTSARPSRCSRCTTPKAWSFPSCSSPAWKKGSSRTSASLDSESRHGRRAALVLRRHDARRETAVPDLGAISPALRRRPAGSDHPIAIPARSSTRAGGRSQPIPPAHSAGGSIRRTVRGARDEPRAISIPARPTTR